uniref:Uncharacterized protein n=1 Tax=Kalanchoe fedtschenkoi TaxID=63787 RepID=A0A7N0V809_KALFE
MVWWLQLWEWFLHLWTGLPNGLVFWDWEWLSSLSFPLILIDCLFCELLLRWVVRGLVLREGLVFRLRKWLMFREWLRFWKWLGLWVWEWFVLGKWFQAWLLPASLASDLLSQMPLRWVLYHLLAAADESNIIPMQ